MLTSTSMRWLVVAVSAAMLLAVAAACAGETVEVPGETVVVEKEVIKTVEVPGETVTLEVIKEVEVPGETVVVKEEVVKEVMVPGETVVVEKVVTETVEVPGETVVVEKEVVKTVEVPGETVVVEKQVPVEVVKTVEVPGPERVMVKEVPGKNYVTDPSNGKVVSAPQYGGTITAWGGNGWASGASDPYFGWAHLKTSGVNEKLGIPNWAIDRDVWDLTAFYTPVTLMIGRLAESWEQPDPLTYVFNIRKGVHWHNKAPMNGRELTAHDIEYNFHRVLGMGDFAEAGPTAFGGADPLKNLPLESVTATDDSTIVMKLTEPRLDMLRVASMNEATTVMPPEVIEQHGDVQDWRNLVGTGPFMVTDVVEDSHITWAKNPDYWGYDEKYPENRLPYVDQLSMAIIPEEASTVAALRSGAIDFRTWNTALDSAESLKKTNPDIAVHTIWFRSSDSFAPDHRRPPFNDINVRRAMQMALDNPTIAATYWKGYADPTPAGLIGVDGFHNPFEEWDEEVKQWFRYDPEAAEQPLDEAGYERGPDGIRFKTTLNYGAWATLDFAEIAAAYWAEIGVEVEIDALTSAEYHERLFGRTGEGMYSAIAGNQFDPVLAVGWYHSDSQWNRGGSQWPELDALVEAALSASSNEEQQRLIAEADEYAMSRHWVIWGPKGPVYFLNQPWLVGYSGELPYIATGEQNLVFTRFWIDSALKAAAGR